jgi:hypothetical protein
MNGHWNEITLAYNLKHLSRIGVKREDSQKGVMESFPLPEEMITFIQKIPTAVLRRISTGVVQYGFRPSDRPVRNDQDG